MTVNEYDAIIADIESNLEGTGYHIDITMANGSIFRDCAAHRRNGSVVKVIVNGDPAIATWIAIGAIAAVALCDL